MMTHIAPAVVHSKATMALSEPFCFFLPYIVFRFRYSYGFMFVYIIISVILQMAALTSIFTKLKIISIGVSP